MSRTETIVAALLFLATWRSNNLATVTGIKLPDSHYFTGSTIESLFVCAALMAMLICFATRARRQDS